MAENFPEIQETNEWRIGGNPPDFASLRGRKRTVLAEQRSAWDEGRTLGPEDLLRGWPVDPSTDPDAASVLAEDFLRRRGRGEQPSVAEYSRRFPGHEGSLAGLVSLRTAFESVGGVSSGQDRLLRLPDLGDEVFGFRLRQKLGQGAFARVFLAHQANLASRPVVLKVSDIQGTEPQTLAQLQHTNIVPIYSVHEDPRAGLRAVCMPYLGGASLSSVLEKAWDEEGQPTRGEQFVRALLAARSPAADTRPMQGDEESTPAAGPPTQIDVMRGQTYIQVAAWLVAQLADGLDHAHRRGILHRDIKPSNVLISVEGQPLLLDFNLAHDVRDDPGESTLGGTIAYMAPEHLRALVEPGSPEPVDQRSDIYSLGMVLGEILTGQNPFEQSGSYSVLPMVIRAMAVERARASPSLRERRPDIPWGLESIARTCLHPEPGRRYQQADHLADDLRRFLEDRPLKYAPELSRSEQVGKYLRRHPRLASVGPVVLGATLVLGGTGWALAGARGHLSATRDRLGEVRARERLRSHEAGTTRAQCLINTTIDLRDNLREGVAVCEQTLALFAPLPRDPGRTRPGWRWLTPEERERVLEDRRELLLSLAGARIRLAPGDAEAARRSLALLAQAEALPGLPPSRALLEEQARICEALGERSKAQDARRRASATPPSGARDLYLLACGLARQGTEDSTRRALAELDRALRLNPRHYWSSVQRGICHLELGDPASAAGDFGVCIGLWPEFAWGHFNRGYALDRGGKKAEAIEDYTAALARDSDFLPGYLNRGLARLELGRNAQALEDLEKARSLGRDDASLHAARAMALEGLGRHPEADAAFGLARARSAGIPEPERLRLRWTCGFAVSARLPEEARAAFDEVLASDPRHPQALYGRAMLAMHGGRLAEALDYFNRAIDADPGFLDARRYRAVLLARRGDWEGAGREINVCLGREPRSGPTLYAAACVAALASRTRPGGGIADQAVDLLRRASAHGEPIGRALTDPDMAGISSHPRFRELIAGAASPPGAADRQVAH